MCGNLDGYLSRSAQLGLHFVVGGVLERTHGERRLSVGEGGEEDDSGEWERDAQSSLERRTKQTGDARGADRLAEQVHSDEREDRERARCADFEALRARVARSEPGGEARGTLETRDPFHQNSALKSYKNTHTSSMTQRG